MGLLIQILTTVIFLLMVIPAYMNVIAGIMGTAQEIASTAWRVVSGIVTLLSFLYPIVTLICVIASWILYAQQHLKAALIISLIPGGWIVLVVALMGILFGIIGPRMS
jgi:hypothetical protein